MASIVPAFIRRRFGQEPQALIASPDRYNYRIGNSQIIMTPEVYAAMIEMVCAIHRLDPALPEVQSLKREAARIIRDPQNAIGILRALDPDDSVSMIDGTPHLRERMPMLQRIILRPISLLRHHVRDFDDKAVRITVDGSGLRIYDWLGMELISVAGAAIEPFRFASDGLRESNAAELLSQITGLDRNELRKLITGDPDRPPIGALAIQRSTGQAWDLDGVTVTHLTTSATE